MSDVATIRKAKGGYIVNVRWPIAGSPMGGGEMICTTFDEACTALMRHLEDDFPIDVHCVVKVVKKGEVT